MPEKQSAAPVCQYRDGKEVERGLNAPCLNSVHHRHADCKTRVALTAAAVLGVLACLCLAECLAGSGWWYLAPAFAAMLTANQCAGAALRKEARHD